jgi:hypothetical protein
MFENLRNIAQSYLGMKPTDKGCSNWAEMQNKMALEIQKCIPASFYAVIDINTGIVLGCFDSLPKAESASKNTLHSYITKLNIL